MADVSPGVRSGHPGGVPAAGGGQAPPAQTAADRDREALDRVLEEAGFSTVDQLDADDYALMREAKLEALAQLCRDLRDNRGAAGKDRLSTQALAHIARQLGAMERGKLEAVQLKVGKPGDRPKRGVTFRAKIGVQGPEDASGRKAAGAAFEVEVKEE